MTIIDNKKVTRGKNLGYVPSGRALHLIDPENLMGGPRAGIPTLRLVLSEYRDVSGFTEKCDHPVIGVNPKLHIAAADAWPSARVVSRGGSDGADIKLIEWVRDDRWIAARYHRIVIGSGDGDFVEVARVFRRHGLFVEVVSRRQCLSRELHAAASLVRILPEVDLAAAA